MVALCPDLVCWTWAKNRTFARLFTHVIPVHGFPEEGRRIYVVYDLSGGLRGHHGSISRLVMGYRRDTKAIFRRLFHDVTPMFSNGLALCSAFAWAG